MRVISRLSALILFAVPACGGSPEPVPERPRPVRGPKSDTETAASSDPALVAHPVAEVPEGTFGPYLAEREQASVVLWAAREGDRRFWFARTLDARAEPVGDSRRIGQAPGDVGLVAVRPLGDEGFLLLSTSREFGGERVDAIGLSDKGTLIGGPTPLAQSLPNVVWVDGLETASGAIAFWAVRRSGSASLHAVEVDRTGAPKVTPSDVVPKARAWQIAPVSSGAAIAYVTADDERGAGGSRVALAFVDAQGSPERGEILVSDSPTAEPDLDMMAVGDRLILAWSDTRQIDPRIYSAAIGADGKILRKPAPLTPETGPQALIRLIPPATGTGPAFVAWESQLDRPSTGIRVRIGSVTPDGERTGGIAVIDHEATDGSLPELDATSRGLGVLALAPACRRDAPCKAERAVPTFLSLDGSLDVVASEPVRLDVLAGAVAELTWGLSCRFFECLALAALPSDPAPVFSVELAGISDDWVPAAQRESSSALPRVDSVQVVGQAPSIADLAATSLGQRKLVAWVTYFDPSAPYVRPVKPAPDGRYAPVRAILSVASTGDRFPVEPNILSYRARSLSGVALAPDRDKKSALLVWSALEGGKPQVFVTSLGPDGKKTQQRMLTRADGDVSGVAAVAADDGWVVGWIDSRGGAPDVYVAHLDRTLARVGPERRLSHGAGNVNSIELVDVGGSILAVWSDARGHDTGVADLFSMRLSAKDGTALGPEVRLTRTRDHTHSPSVASFGDGAVVAWLEEGRVASGEGAAVRLMLQRLDSGGEPAGERLKWSFADRPLGLSLDCGESECRIVVSAASRERGALHALSFVPGRDAAPARLVGLSLPPREAVPPVIAGADVYYADQTDGADMRIRRLDVTWTRPRPGGGS